MQSQAIREDQGLTGLIHDSKRWEEAASSDSNKGNKLIRSVFGNNSLKSICLMMKVVYII